MSEPIKAIIFDLFGTLLYISRETKPYHRLFAHLDLNPEQLSDARRACLTENLPDISAVAKRLRPDRKIDTSFYCEEIRKEIDSALLYPETLEVIVSLKKRGVKLGLASNLATPYTDVFFKCGLSEFIPCPVFSCDERTMKPERRIYELALNRVDTLPCNALMVGDKLDKDVHGPAALGMRSVLIDRAGLHDYSPRISTLRDLLDHI